MFLPCIICEVLVGFVSVVYVTVVSVKSVILNTKLRNKLSSKNFLPFTSVVVFISVVVQKGSVSNNFDWN